MLALVLQSALMLAIAFIAGCFIGHFARGLTKTGKDAPQ